MLGGVVVAIAGSGLTALCGFNPLKIAKQNIVHMLCKLTFRGDGLLDLQSGLQLKNGSFYPSLSIDLQGGSRKVSYEGFKVGHL